MASLPKYATCETDGSLSCRTVRIYVQSDCPGGFLVDFVNFSESYSCGFGREANKAFCGFLDQSNCDHHKSLFQDGGSQGSQCMETDEDTNVVVKDFPVRSPPVF